MGLVVNFSDFVNKTGTSLSASDYLVGFTTDFDGNRQEIRITVADLITYMESNSGNDLYTILNQNSANWINTYTTVSIGSAAWNTTYSNVNANSANWQSTYSNVNANSANWQSTYSNVNANSATTFVSVCANNLLINASNKNTYVKKFILLQHDDTATVTIDGSVGTGFNCRIFNNSTHYVILSSFNPFTLNSKGYYINDQYGLATVDSDGVFIYSYGDLENVLGPAYPDALLNEDQSFILYEDDSLILY